MTEWIIDEIEKEAGEGIAALMNAMLGKCPGGYQTSPLLWAQENGIGEHSSYFSYAARILDEGAAIAHPQVFVIYEKDRWSSHSSIVIKGTSMVPSKAIAQYHALAQLYSPTVDTNDFNLDLGVMPVERRAIDGADLIKDIESIFSTGDADTSLWEYALPPTAAPPFIRPSFAQICSLLQQPPSSKVGEILIHVTQALEWSKLLREQVEKSGQFHDCCVYGPRRFAVPTYHEFLRDEVGDLTGRMACSVCGKVSDVPVDDEPPYSYEADAWIEGRESQISESYQPKARRVMTQRPLFEVVLGDSRTAEIEFFLVSSTHITAADRSDIRIKKARIGSDWRDLNPEEVRIRGIHLGGVIFECGMPNPGETCRGHFDFTQEVGILSEVYVLPKESSNPLLCESLTDVEQTIVDGAERFKIMAAHANLPLSDFSAYVQMFLLSELINKGLDVNNHH